MSVKSKVAGKIVGKTAGRAVPGVGQVIMLVEGVPVAVDEGSDVWREYKKLVKRKSGKDKVKLKDLPGHTKAKLMQVLQVQREAGEAIGKTALAAVMAKEAGEAVFGKDNPEEARLSCLPSELKEALGRWELVKIESIKKGRGGDLTAVILAVSPHGELLRVQLRCLIDTWLFERTWEPSDLEKLAFEAKRSRDNPTYRRFSGSSVLEPVEALEARGYPLAPAKVQHLFNPRWTPEHADQYSNSFVLPNGLYIRWSEDAGPRGQLGSQYVVFSYPPYKDIEFIDPDRPGFGLKIKRAGRKKVRMKKGRKNPMGDAFHPSSWGTTSGSVRGYERGRARLEAARGKGWSAVYAWISPELRLKRFKQASPRQQKRAVAEGHFDPQSPEGRLVFELREVGKGAHREVVSGARTLIEAARDAKVHWASTKGRMRPGLKRTMTSALNNPVMSDAELYQDVLAHLRALQWVYWTAHWTAAGPNYYGDHLLLQRLYEGGEEEAEDSGGPDIQAQIDGLGERMVAYFGPGAVNPGLLVGRVRQLTDRAVQNSTEPFEALLKMEMGLQTAIRRAWKANQDSGDSFSLGIDDYLMSLASERDTAVYLLRRRLGGRKPLAGRVDRPRALPAQTPPSDQRSEDLLPVPLMPPPPVRASTTWESEPKLAAKNPSKRKVEAQIKQGFLSTTGTLPLPSPAEIERTAQKVLERKPAHPLHYAFITGQNWARDLYRQQQRAARMSKAEFKRQKKTEKMRTGLQAAREEFKQVAARMVEETMADPRRRRHLPTHKRNLRFLWDKYLEQDAPLSPHQIRALYPDLSLAARNKIEQRGRKLLKRHGASEELLAFVRTVRGKRSTGHRGRAAVPRKFRRTWDNPGFEIRPDVVRGRKVFRIFFPDGRDTGKYAMTQDRALSLAQRLQKRRR